MNLPKRKKRQRFGSREETRIRCPQHLQWVRGHECAINHRAEHICFQHRGRESAHVRTGTDGGIGIKPGDNWTIPLCALAHHLQHTIGEPEFECRYSIDMKAIAAELWRISPHGIRYRAKQLERT